MSSSSGLPPPLPVRWVRCWHTETIGFGVGIAAAILCFVSPAFASPQPPLNCAASPFGPPDADGWITIPYTLSSRRFQYDRAEIPAQKYYANNTDYRWQTWFSGNVTHVKFGFDIGSSSSPGFRTEYGYDFLTIGSLSPLSGNLDDSHQVYFVSNPTSLQFTTAADNYVNMRWTSDYSNVSEGWTITSIKVFCERANYAAAASSLASKLHYNEQRDGVLLGTGDIRHFMTVLPADRPVLIHLKSTGPPAPGTTYADYDLYASWETTTTTPGPGVVGVDFDWKSDRATGPDGRMEEDALLILPWGGVPHNLYFAVYAYAQNPSRLGGFRVYDNVVGRQFVFNAGSDFDFVNGDGGVNWTPIMLQNLYGAAAGLYQATDGSALLTQWNLWNADETCGGQGCQVLFTNPYTASSCIGASCGFQGRVMDRAWGQGRGAHGYALSHEFGHCLYGMIDEYNTADAGTGFKCGHSLMSLGVYLNATDFCTGVSANCVQGSPILPNGNHNADCVTPGPIPLNIQSPSYWPRIAACFPEQTAYYSPSGSPPTPDPEVWIYGTSDISDIFEHKAYTTITKKNF